MKTKQTEKHAQFFALLESNITKPNTIKWERGITDLVTQESKPQQAQPFGVSLAEAFEKGGIK
jgi:hypothetical protein